MYLKKLEITGFKSFAKKTEIVFEKGVTCVVGPNGCGKSNISDAIRWVLGERSAKMLRGSKMEDVIFQGTDFRDPINFAEVTILIDNADHVLPIAFDEVAITRRLHRSGESEYLINKTLCRLKDIQNLILDTGIGSNSYSMIEQGRIDYILSAEAEERRFLIEEAAGISKFKVKKDEAVRKLDQTEQNLLRLQDIIAEVERNIKYAERQARRAEQYKVHFEKLKSLELADLAVNITKLNETKTELLRERSKLENKIEEDGNILQTVQEKFKQAEEACRTSEKDYFTAEQNRTQLEQKLISTQREHEIARERYHETKVSLERAAEEIVKIEENLQRFVKDISVKEGEFQALETAHEKLVLDKNETETEFAKLQETLNERSLFAFQFREQSFDIAAHLANTKNEFNKFTADSHSLVERRNQIVNMVGRLTNELEVIKNDETRLVQEIQNAKHALKQQEETARFATRIKVQGFHEFKQLQSELHQFKEKRSEAVHRLQFLNQLDGAGFVNAKELLAKNFANTGEQKEIRALLDLLEIDEGYEVAVAAALSDLSKAIVTEDTKTAVQLINQIQSSGHHQASIVIHNRIKEIPRETDRAVNSHSLIRMRLLNVIRIKPGFEKLFDCLLGDVCVIDDMTEENAGELAELSNRVRLVSKKGACLGPGFHLSLRNGSLAPIKDLMTREKEKGELTSRLKSLELDIQEKEARIHQLEIQAESKESILKNESEQSISLQLQLQRMETTLSALKNQKEKHGQEIEFGKKDLEESTAEEKRLLARQEYLTIEIERLTSEEKRLKSLLDQELEWIEENKSTKEKQLINLTRASTRLETHEENKKRAVDALGMMRTSQSDSEARSTSLFQEQKELKERLGKLSALSEALQKETANLQSNLIQASSLADQKNILRNDHLSRKTILEDEKNEQLKIFNTYQNNLHHFEKKELEIDYAKKSALDRVRNTYHLAVEESELVQYLPTTEPENAETRQTLMYELRKKVETFGTVNLLAISEYEELKQRFDFLSTQKKDLEESKEALLEAIRKINRTTKQLFEETLTRVREMFKVYFKILFQGGESDLVLIDEKNPLDSGIDIVARPPGKKPQHISLLSGGEKAMTAIALLFALFKIKPSPFCVLDEIDAPLDESNNERFLHVIREFLVNTQFIIVTHSRKTITMSDSLYGVTMEEAGISKIVSVKVSQSSWTIEHQDEKIQKELNAVIQ